MNGAMRVLGVVAAVGFLVWAGAQADARTPRAGESAQPEAAAISRPTPPAVQKGGDGAACSSDEECKSGTCEGGSCCTDHGATCTASSHCCGHQSCTDGSCP